MAVKLSKADMKALLARAAEAATEAREACTPTPMVVGTPKNMMASLMGGDDGGFREDRPIEVVSGGVCGRGDVNIKPGNSRLANYLRKEDLGRTNNYHGGLDVRLYELVPGMRFDQSYERNVAAATAFAKVLREAGINAHIRTWVD